MPPEETEGEKTEQQQQTTPTAPTREEILAEIDSRLQARDQALLGAINQQMTAFAEHMKGVASPQQQQVASEAQQQLNISPEEFWRDPQNAMTKFYEAKVKPALDKQEQEQARRQPDPSGLIALVETQKIQLAQRVGNEEFTKYSPFLQKVLAKTDPRVIADPVGMDAVWRLTKSYADEHIANQDKARVNRNLAASLSSSGASTSEQQKKVELTEEQNVVAKGMGISPEHFEQYKNPEEIDIGSNRRKK